MTKDDVRNRIEYLLARISQVVRVDGNGQLVNAEAKAACSGWIAAAVNVINVACAGDHNSAYVRQALDLQTSALRLNYIMHQNVLALGEILRYLIIDIDSGFLVSLERRISAETYDDLMDHAEAYLAENRKDPAGVIAGVVFEDTIRRTCLSYDIDIEGKTVDPLINALATQGVLTKLEGKEARACAEVRAKATHALWHEFNAEQVDVVIRFTKRLIREKLTA